MKLSAHFSLDEFCASDTACRRQIDNTLPAELLNSAIDTAAMLERIRSALSAKAGREIPIRVTSGYRCPQLNALVGSAPTSDHLRGMAADFVAPDFGTPQQVATFLASHVEDLGIGQLIAEFGQWTHCSTRRPDKEINRIITIDRTGTHPGIVSIA